MSSAPSRDRDARLAIAGVIALGVVLRLLVVRAQGFPTDVGTFEAWGERIAQVGPGGFYEPGYFSDYPPAFLYVLWLLGALFDGEILRLAVKAISIPADVVIAALAAAVAWRHAGRGPAVAAATLWSLQPGPIFAGPYWGQVDAVGTLPLVGALVAAGARRWSTAGALAALAALVKPQFGIALGVIVVAVAIDFVRDAAWRPAARVIGAAVATAYVIAAPFYGLDPLGVGSRLVDLVRSASETYPYTSLYAFNGWSIFFDFWQPDEALVRYGALLLVAGLVVSCAPLWWRRDLAGLLAATAFAAFAFYFLPTRAHERYLFPAFALLLPFAAARSRILGPYLVLAAGFATTLYFAFTRYQQIVDLRAPDVLEATLFGRYGQIALALLMIATAALIVWRLARGEARLDSDRRYELALAAPRPTWTLPPGLGLGRVPSRGDLMVALCVALAVLATRGYRLDFPRDMYFDEVYHARTAFELLAQREPYEWTHPHLAKEIMALGILAFGDDRVIGHEVGLGAQTLFTVTNDGIRLTAGDDGNLYVRDRLGRGGPFARTTDPPRALAATDGRIVVATDRQVCQLAIPVPSSRTGLRDPLPFDRCLVSPFARTLGLAIGGTSVSLASAGGLATWKDFTGDPVVYQGDLVAATAKADGSEVYVLDPKGNVEVVDTTKGSVSRTLSGGGPGSAIAYALGPNRVFVARAKEPVLDVYDLEGGSHEGVPLANARTGAFASGVTALAVVTRTQFLYALADGRVVVVETHGASPFAAIATGATQLGIDGEGDVLVAAGPTGADVVETGRHAFAWRLPGVVFAALLAFCVVLLARRLFASGLVPALAGTAIVLDGSMFAQARIGMNDVYVGALIVAGWYFVVAAYRPRRSATTDILIAGVLLGLAAATKWAAFYAVAGVAIASLAVTAYAYRRGRSGSGGALDLAGVPEVLARRGVALAGLNAVLLFVAFAVIPVILYVGSYVPWFGGPTIPFHWDLVELTKQMYWYHSGLTAPHPAGSPWWSWPLVLKPVYWYFGSSSAGDNAYIYDAGNVVLFWGGLVAFGWCAVAAVRARSVALGFVLFAALVQYVAWIPITRVLFFYHFFTALPFYLLALAAALAFLWETGRARFVVGYIALAGAAFVYFYPFISAQPVAGAQAGMFFVLPTWTYDCQFYPTFVCNVALGGSFSVGALALRLALALAVAGGLALLAVGIAPPLSERLRLRASSEARR